MSTMRYRSICRYAGHWLAVDLGGEAVVVDHTEQQVAVGGFEAGVVERDLGIRALDQDRGVRAAQVAAADREPSDLRGLAHHAVDHHAVAVGACAHAVERDLGLAGDDAGDAAGVDRRVADAHRRTVVGIGAVADLVGDTDGVSL